MSNSGNPYKINRFASGQLATQPIAYPVGRSLLVGGVACAAVWVVSWIIPIPIIVGGAAAALWGIREYRLRNNR